MCTRWILVGVLVSMSFFFAQQETKAQGIFEYGKQLGTLKRPKGHHRGVKMFGTVNRSEGAEQLPIHALPPMLSVKGKPIYLYTRQDKHSEAVTKLEDGEKLIPLGQAFGSGEAWYMVKTRKGAVGWVASSAVGKDTGRQVKGIQKKKTKNQR